MAKKVVDAGMFEEKLQELEKIVAEIESPSCPLEKAIELCARGMGLYAELSQRLTKLERKVQEVKNLKGLAEDKEQVPVMELFSGSEDK